MHHALVSEALMQSHRERLRRLCALLPQETLDWVDRRNSIIEPALNDGQVTT
jgi:hypothetical protein